MNVRFLVLVFVYPLCRLWRVSYVRVCTLVLLWAGCGISLPKIGHFNIDVISGVLKWGLYNGCYMWTKCKLCVWIEVCGVNCFSMNFCSRVCANPLCGIWRDVYVCMYVCKIIN